VTDNANSLIEVVTEIVWATGMGQVHFRPLIHGKVGETVIFDDVLYVPAL
jgi:hypothetical protein